MLAQLNLRFKKILMAVSSLCLFADYFITNETGGLGLPNLPGMGA